MSFVGVGLFLLLAGVTCEIREVVSYVFSSPVEDAAFVLQDPLAIAVKFSEGVAVMVPPDSFPHSVFPGLFSLISKQMREGVWLAHHTLDQTQVVRWDPRRRRTDTLLTLSGVWTIRRAFACQNTHGIVAEGKTGRYMTLFRDHVPLTPMRYSLQMVGICDLRRNVARVFGYNPMNAFPPAMGQWDYWIRVGVLSLETGILLDAWQKPVEEITSTALWCPAQGDTCLFLTLTSPWSPRPFQAEIYRAVFHPEGLQVHLLRTLTQCGLFFPGKQAWWWLDVKENRAMRFDLEGHLLRNIGIDQIPEELCRSSLPVPYDLHLSEGTFVAYHTFPRQGDPRYVKGEPGWVIFYADADTLVRVDHATRARLWSFVSRKNDAFSLVQEKSSKRLRLWQYICEK